MTLGAVKRGREVEVTITYGPVFVIMREHLEHARSFWSSLGRVLDEIDHEQETPKDPA